MTIVQVFNMNTRTSNRMTAVRQVQQAGFWVSPDVQMAQSVDASGNSSFLTLNWTEYPTGNNHTVVYNLTDMSAGLKKLQRSHSINDGDPTVILVAEYIDPSGTSCSYTDPALNFTVTATVGEESETRLYEVKRRPET